MKNALKKTAALLLALTLLLTGLPAASAASEAGVRVLSSGELGEDYYIPTSGTPISGADQVVFDGTRFFTAETTAERKLMGYWFTADGAETEQSVLIADLSGTTGNLSQPSLCVLNGEIYVGWAAIADAAQNDLGGGQYIAKIRADGTVSEAVCIRSDSVWPRRPALCAGEDGVLLVYRVYEEGTDCDYGYEYWAHMVYAAFVAPELTFSAPYRVNSGNHAIYPSAAYSPESKQFLIVWDHGRVMGALVTKDTAEMPENKELIFFQNRSTQRPMAACDGTDFLVTCDLVHPEDYYDEEGVSYRGLWAVKVAADGTVGTPVHTVRMQGDRDSLYSGQVRWDGDGWLIGYCCERDEQLRWDVGSELVDFRLSDSFILRLNADTLLPEGAPIGVGTGWWHQFHTRFALAPDGTVFCTYLDSRSGSTRLRWFCFAGRSPVIETAEAADSGLTLQRCTPEGIWTVYGGDGDGRTAWLMADRCCLWNGTGWELRENIEFSGKTFDSYARGDALYVASWSGSVLRALRGASAEEDRLEFAADFGACGDVPCCGVWYASDGTLWIAASDGRVWSKTGGAPTMVLRYDCGETGCDLHAIHGSGPDDIYAVGDRGLLVHWDGSAWTRIETPVCTALNGVRADGAGAWIVGDGGVLLRAENGVCTQAASPAVSDLYDIWSLSPERFFVCGLKDGVWYWQNGEWYRVGISRGDPEDYWSAQYGALTDVYGLVEGDSLRLFVLSVAEDYARGVYTVTLPLLESERPHSEHEPGEAAEENRVEPNCTEPGSYDLVVRCKLCGTELSRETVTIPALGHDWGEWTETKPATMDAEGEEHRVCARCGEEETGPIPRLEPLPGDADGDRDTDAEDVKLLFRHVSGAAAAAEGAVLDLDGDGKVNDRDVVLLFRTVFAEPR